MSKPCVENILLLHRILEIFTNYLAKIGYRTIGNDVFTEKEYADMMNGVNDESESKDIQ